MKVDIKSKDKTDIAFRPIIEEETEKFISEHEINPDAVLSFNFISEIEIKELNQKYRKINQPTDVLSFPIWKNLSLIPKKGIVNLGDIFINNNQVLKNAKKSNKDLTEELRFIVWHSLNHLIGKHH